MKERLHLILLMDTRICTDYSTNENSKEEKNFTGNYILNYLHVCLFLLLYFPFQCLWKLRQTNKEFFDCMLKRVIKSFCNTSSKVIKFNMCCEQMGKLIKKVHKNDLHNAEYPPVSTNTFSFTGNFSLICGRNVSTKVVCGIILFFEKKAMLKI